jgi:hypothetical protein
MQLRSSLSLFFKRFGCSPKEQVVMQHEIDKTATRQQVAEVVLSLARKKVAEAELEEQCEMHLNRLQVQVEAFTPLESRLDGHIARIFRHVDLVIPLALLCVLSATVAMGQTLSEQKVCHGAAKKFHDPHDVNTTVYNHYDPKTSTCWIMTVTDYNVAPAKQGDASFGSLPPFTRSEAEEFNKRYAGPNKDIIIFNAFEEHSTEAWYIGPTLQEPMTCIVSFKRCHSLVEFNTLVRSHYHGF